MISLWLLFYWSPIWTCMSQSPWAFWWCSEGTVTFSTQNHRIWFSSNSASQPAQHQLHHWIGCCLKQIPVPLTWGCSHSWQQTGYFLSGQRGFFYVPPKKEEYKPCHWSELQDSCSMQTRTPVCLTSRALGVQLLVCFPSKLAGWLRWGYLELQSVTESGHPIIKIHLFFLCTISALTFISVFQFYAVCLVWMRNVQSTWCCQLQVMSVYYVH